MTPTKDDTDRAADLLMRALRLTLSDESGDPERLLAEVAHPSLNIVERYRWFASLVEAYADMRRLDWRAADVETLDDYTTAYERAGIAALILVYGVPEVEAAQAA